MNPNKLSTTETPSSVSQRDALAHYVAKHETAPVRRAGYSRGPGRESYSLDHVERIRASFTRAYFVGRSSLYLGY